MPAGACRTRAPCGAAPGPAGASSGRVALAVGVGWPEGLAFMNVVHEQRFVNAGHERRSLRGPPGRVALEVGVGWHQGSWPFRAARVRARLNPGGSETLASIEATRTNNEWEKALILQRLKDI